MRLAEMALGLIESAGSALFALLSKLGHRTYTIALCYRRPLFLVDLSYQTINFSLSYSI